MRLFVAVMFAWYCAASVQSGEPRPRTAPLQFYGQDYTSLQDWAEANKFQVSLLKKEEEVRLTNRWARLEFKLNTQRAEVNGVNLFLAFPIVLHQGSVWIAQKDIDRSLRPILFPTKGGPPIKIVALSAGHGGKDCGYQLGSEQEKKYTLLLAKELQRLLTRAGMKAVLVRSSDRAVELDDRPRLAKRNKADVYLELHYNSAGTGNDETRGVEVYSLTPAGANSTNGGSDQYPGPLPGNRHDERNILLAYKIQSSMVESLGLVDRGVRRARWAVLRDAEMPAVLIEAGFMSQPDEMRKIRDAAYRRRSAQAILDGLLAYRRLVER